MEEYIREKYAEKAWKYQQLAFEAFDKRPGFTVEIARLVAVCLGIGMSRREK